MEYLFLAGIIAGAYLQEYCPLAGPRSTRTYRTTKEFTAFGWTVYTTISDGFVKASIGKSTNMPGVKGLHVSLGRVVVSFLTLRDK